MQNLISIGNQLINCVSDLLAKAVVLFFTRAAALDISSGRL